MTEGTGPIRARLGALRPLIWLAILLAVVLHAPIFVGRVPLPAEIVTNFPLWESWRQGPGENLRHAEMGDLVTLFFPWKVYFHDAVRHGHFPLWNSRSLMGTPFGANSMPAPFFPTHLAGLLLPVKADWSLHFPLWTFLAVLLGGLFAYRIGVSLPGACVSGVVWGLNGFLVSWQGYSLSATTLLLPLPLLGVEALRNRPDPLRLAGAAVAFALPILAGHPQSTFYCFLTAGAWGLFRASFPPAGTETRSLAARSTFLLLLVAAALLGAGLAAVHLLPVGEWVSLLTRKVDRVLGWKIPLARMVAFLSRDMGSSPSPLGFNVPEQSAYGGILTLVLAPFAFTGRHRREALFFGFLLVIAGGIAYGLPPFYRLSLAVPVLQGLPPGRLLGLVTLALAVLAGLGLTALEEVSREVRLPRSRRVLGGAVIGVLVGGLVLLLLHHRHEPQVLLGPQGLVSSLVLALLAAVWLAWGLMRRELSAGFAWAALGLVTVDLLSSAWGRIPFVPSSGVFPVPELYRFLEESDRTVYRVATVDGTAPANAEVAFGLESPTGYDYVLKRTGAFLAPLTGQGRNVPFISWLLSEKIVSTPGRSLDLMNVKYLVANSFNGSAERLLARTERFRLVRQDGSCSLVENLNVLPRAFLVPASGIEVLPGDDEALRRVEDAGFDPLTRVVLQTTPTWPAAESTPATESLVNTIRSDYGETSIDLSVTAPSLLVVSETYYPGWKAIVDGQEAPVLRADYLFRAVALAPGVRSVRFRYAPASFRAGAAVTALSLVLVGGLVAAGLRRPVSL